MSCKPRQMTPCHDRHLWLSSTADQEWYRRVDACHWRNVKVVHDFTMWETTYWVGSQLAGVELKSATVACLQKHCYLTADHNQPQEILDILDHTITNTWQVMPQQASPAPHCKVLPTGKLIGMIPDPHFPITLITKIVTNKLHSKQSHKQVRQQDSYLTNAGVQLKLRTTTPHPLFKGNISVADCMPLAGLL